MGLRDAVLLALAASAAIPSQAHGQSAGKIVERYVEASGGKAALQKIVSTEMSGRVSVGSETSGTFTLRTQRPRLLSMSVSGIESGWRTGFNGRASWLDERPDGPRTLYGEAAARVRADAVFANTRYVPSDHVIELSVRGREQVRGRPVIAVVVLAPDGLTRTLFFDTETDRLVKDEQRTEAGIEERFFDDYRPVDGVLEAHRIEWHRNGQVFRVEIDRVTHNRPLDAQLFDVPVPRAEQSGDIAPVLAAAGRAEERVAQARAPYAFMHLKSLTNLDHQGRVTRTESALFDVFHIAGGRPVGQLLRVNGEPLTDAERRRQEERLIKFMQEYERRRRAGTVGDPGQAEPPWGAMVLYQVPLMAANRWLSSYLRMSEFSNLRRERVASRAALVMEFEPKRGSTAARDFDKQIGSMAGVVWIDEATQQLVRVESYFSETFRQLVPGSSSRMELTLVDDQIWLPLRSETHVRRRRGSADPFHMDEISQFSDHKRFGVTTDTVIALPEPVQ